MKYRSTKLFDHNLGLSCAFRQWKAESHCSKLHGYALAIKLVFETDKLDENGWTVDFGSMKPLKAKLEEYFDHKTLVAEDDPKLPWFQAANDLGILDLVVVQKTGCEAFAKFIHDLTLDWMYNFNYTPRVKLISVEVMEHQANSAIHIGE